MSFYISQKEYDDFAKKLTALKIKKNRLSKFLGKIMGTSGSFTSKTPGFSDTENQLHDLDKKISTIEVFLSQSIILKNEAELDVNKITIYSLVSVFDKDKNKKIKYYIQHNLSEEKESDYQVITLTSPIGKSLIDKKIGDQINIKLSDSTLHLEILDISKKL